MSDNVRDVIIAAIAGLPGLVTAVAALWVAVRGSRKADDAQAVATSARLAVEREFGKQND